MHGAYAGDRLRRKLIADAMPVLTQKAHSEFLSVPVRGREEIRRWFHGKALNVASFVEEVCSSSHREKLHACHTEEEKQLLLQVTFFGKVATDAEILNRIQVIAEEVGRELDLNWGSCCQSIASRWELHLTGYGSTLELREFNERVASTVGQHVREALDMAEVGTRHPALGETLGGIGESALLVLPMSRLKAGKRGIDVNLMAVPTFFLLALRDVCRYVIGLLSDPRPDLQRAISARISLLGNRIGSDFESVVRTQLDALHDWQEHALTTAAEHYAESATHW